MERKCPVCGKKGIAISGFGVLSDSQCEYCLASVEVAATHSVVLSIISAFAFGYAFENNYPIWGFLLLAFLALRVFRGNKLIHSICH